MVPNSVLLLVGVAFALYLLNEKRRRMKLPPGPPGLPLIGNLHQVQPGAIWNTYKSWVKQYGNLVSASFGGTTVIIIGDYETAKNLLDKRASIYSSRPRMVMASELTCHGNQILLKPFGAEYLLHQRLEAPVLSPRASACYTPIQDLESKQLLNNLLGTTDFVHEIERYAGSITYSMAFGMRIITGKERQLKTSQECLDNMTHAGQTGTWIVDSLPWLNHLPAPFTPWKKTAEAWFQKWDTLHKSSYREALARDGWNWAKDLQAGKEAQMLTEEQVAWDVGILCDAGVETTGVTLKIFILACVASPEWIPKAQKELDEVVGSERLPDFDDLKKLPYIQAVVEENFRWRHNAPAGIPHATTQDDYYNGYLIPKNSLVVPFYNAMRQDPRIFDAPSEFRPERWLHKSQSGNFGYGRRICTGRHIARNSLAIAIARLLWAFDIRPIDGKPMAVDESMFTTRFVSHPKNFDAVLKPRSEARAAIIEEAYEVTEKDIACLLDRVREKQVSIGIQPRA